MRYISTLMLVVFMLPACLSQQKEKHTETEAVATISNEQLEKGGQLLTTACYVCHSPALPQDGRLAPPMVAVKLRYSMTEQTEKDFVDTMVSFTTDPTVEKSRMPGAVDRFGLMPALAYSEEDLRAIATYIYRNELPEPAWFKDHYNEMHPANGKSMQTRSRYRRGGN